MVIYERSAGAIVFRIDEKTGEPLFLLLQYPSGYWEFPRGNVEPGESDIDAAKREIYEETGIKKLEFIFGFRYEISFFYRRNNKLVRKTIVFFLAKTNEVNVKLSFEHKGFAWLPYKKALARIKFKNSRIALEKAYSYLKSMGIVK